MDRTEWFEAIDATMQALRGAGYPIQSVSGGRRTGVLIVVTDHVDVAKIIREAAAAFLPLIPEGDRPAVTFTVEEELF